MEIAYAVLLAIVILGALGVMTMIAVDVIRDGRVPKLPRGYTIAYVEERIRKSNFDKYVLYDPDGRDIDSRYASLRTPKQAAAELARAARQHERYIRRR